MLHLLGLNGLRFDLSELNVEHLIINAIGFQVLQFFIEVLLQGVHDLARYDRINLLLNRFDERLILILLPQFKQLAQLLKTVLVLQVLRLYLLEFVVEVLVERLRLVNCLEWKE